MADPSWGELRSRTITWYDPIQVAAAGLSMSGLKLLQAVRDGLVPPPPISQLFQMGINAVEPGRVEFTCQLNESAYNPIGVVHGGLVCTMLDTVVGCAVHTTLPVGSGHTSIEIKVSYLRPVHGTSGPLVANGKVVKPAVGWRSPRGRSATPPASWLRPRPARCSSSARPGHRHGRRRPSED